MPYYHFHLDGDPDVEGQKLKDIAEAKSVAISFAGAHLCDQAERFWDDPEWILSVGDKNGLSLFQIQVIGQNA